MDFLEDIFELFDRSKKKHKHNDNYHYDKKSTMIIIMKMTSTSIIHAVKMITQRQTP